MKLKAEKQRGRTNTVQDADQEYLWQTTRIDGHAEDAATLSGRSDLLFSL